MKEVKIKICKPAFAEGYQEIVNLPFFIELDVRNKITKKEPQNAIKNWEIKKSN